MRTADVVVVVVCPMWVIHGSLTVVCCLRVRYGGRRQQGSSLHRLRASHVIASGVDVRCTVTDAVSTPVLLFLFRRWNACNCLIVNCITVWCYCLYVRPSSDWLFNCFLPFGNLLIKGGRVSRQPSSRQAARGLGFQEICSSTCTRAWAAPAGWRQRGRLT